ncbi:MAG: uroporphyrinogen-III synthase [Halothiobacillaceae bacterium]
MTEPSEDLPDRVILTRPAGRNEALAARLTDSGVAVEIMPAIAIEAVEGLNASRLMAEQTPEDWVFFVSVNAVRMADQLCPLTDWPARHFVAVGRATASALAEAGRPPEIVPTPGAEETEGLLARLNPEWLHGRGAWIVRGCGGRDLLRDSLARMGARVHLLEVYRRLRPPMDVESLATRSQRPLWMVTSPEALTNIVAAAPSGAVRDWLLNSDLVVINERTRHLAREQGFAGGVLVSGGPDDEAMARVVRKVFC